jgi:hypothetical protein
MEFIKSKSLGFEGNAVLEVRFFGDQHVRDQYASLRNSLMQNPFILNVSKHNSKCGGRAWEWLDNNRKPEGKEISTSLYNISV